MIQLAMTVLDAGLTSPLMVMKRASTLDSLFLSSDLLSIALIHVIEYSQIFGCLEIFQPDFLKDDRSVLDPKVGHMIISSPRFSK